MKLTLTCDCGNTETIEINKQRMAEDGESNDTIYIDDFEIKNKKFYHHQSHPDESTLNCTNCSKEIQIIII